MHANQWQAYSIYIPLVMQTFSLYFVIFRHIIVFRASCDMLIHIYVLKGYLVGTGQSYDCPNARGHILLTWINFNSRMDKQLLPLWSVGWYYLSIPKLQRLDRWSLGMDK